MQIFFAGHETGKFPDGRTELQIKFADKRVKPYAGNTSEYTWTPKWDDLQLIFILAYTVERLNRGDDFKPLVEVAKEVYTHHKEYIENPKPGHDRWGFKA
ncbi:MAG: hypothetical protein NTW48_07340 [Chloroflexi bacterium]|nr:hypothetical protein [Chloroflexota bacterium]